MIKRLFFATLMLLVVQSADAQRIKAYFNMGATAAQIEGDELKGFRKWGMSAGVGAMTALTKNEQWLLGVETNVSQRGAFNATGDPYSIRLQLNYVDIPLTIYYHDLKGGMYVGAGLVYGRLVQQPHGEMRYNPNYFIPDTTDMSFNKGDLCWALEARFAVWKGLMLSMRYQSSLLPIKENWGFTEYIRDRPETWYNNLYNQSITLRLMWVFGEEGKRRRR